MKLNKYTLIFLSTILITSLGVLLLIQFRIIKQNIENNRKVIENAIPGILSDLYDNLMFSNDLDKFTKNYQGTEDFSFHSNSQLKDSLQIILKSGIEEVLAINYPELDYELNGFVSSEYGCMIHRHHRPGLPKANRVMEAENHMCFCMILDSTLDISMEYFNKDQSALINSAGLLAVSFLLIIIILIIFGYTFRIIRKQKKLSDLKRDFINNLTHEFKTPIFSISLAAKSLKEKNKTHQLESLDTYADLIGDETNRLKTQVDKILQIAMLDSGQLTLEKKPVDLHEAIKKVAAGFAIIIEKKQGKVSLNLQAGNPVITADETHLNNLLYNLIDNGQKFSEGSPYIEILTQDHPMGISFTIKDHGIGMDKITQKYIFDQFYRASQGDLHNVKGFGLGLSYVKKIVDFHKGSISLKSEPGKGSEFTIILPQVS